MAGVIVMTVAVTVAVRHARMALAVTTLAVTTLAVTTLAVPTLAVPTVAAMVTTSSATGYTARAGGSGLQT